MTTTQPSQPRALYSKTHYKASAVLLAALALASSASAAQRTWVGNSDANLLTATNYFDSTAPVNNSDGILFNAAGLSGTNLVLNTAGTQQFSNTGGALIFSATSSAYTFTGQAVTTELIYGTGGIVNNSSNTQTFDVAVRRNSGNAIVIGANNGSLVFNNTFDLRNGIASFSFGTTTGGSVVLNGNIIDTATAPNTGSITLSNSSGTGSGTVVINGSNNTGLDGTLTIGTNNVVRIGHANALANLATMAFGPNGGSNSASLINDANSAISTSASMSITTAGNIVFGESGDTSANNITFNGTAAIAADTNRTITVNGTGVTVSTAGQWNNASAGTSRTLTINGAGNTFQVGGIAIAAAGDEAINRGFTVAGTGNLTITSGLTNGATSTGTRALTVNTSGVVTINGNSDYTGTTTVSSASTLRVNGTHTGGNTYTINGTLGGTGTIGSATIISSTGKLEASTVNNLAFNSTLNLSAALGAASPSMSFNLGAPGGTAVSVGGLFTIGSGLMNFDDFSFSTSSGFGAGTYTLFEYSSISGTIGSSLTGTIGGLSATISQDTVGNAIIVTVVPEPSSAAALAGLGALGLVALRRRRRA